MVIDTPEDFSSWEVEDSDNRLRVDKNKVEWNHADRTKVRYISMDLGHAEIFDFDHSFDVCLLESFTVSKAHRGLLRFWECRKDWENRIWIFARQDMDKKDKWTIHLEQKSNDNDLWAFESTFRFNLMTTYYVMVARRGNACRLRVYSDLLHTHLLEDSEDIQGVNETYQYVWICSTLCTKKNQANCSSGFIENFQIKPKPKF